MPKKADHTTRNAVLVIVAVAIIFVALSRNSLPSTPTPQSINPSTPIITVFDDGSATLSSGSLNWGTLQGSSVTQEVFVKNEANRPLETLAISATNWSPPEAAQDLSLSWTYAGSQQLPLQPGSEMPIDLTLTVSANANMQDLSDFRCTVVVTAT